MGMGASQARLLALTNRSHSIGRQLQHLSLEKMSLTREMQKVSRNYNQALNGKVLKWSNNSGVNYVDLTYSTLMKPNTSNNNNPILLTNSSGKIVINQSYKKYAEMLSPDGSSGGDWSGDTRISILSKLTGISEETLKSFETAHEDVEAAEAALDDAGDDETAYDEAYKNYLAAIDTENQIFKANEESQIDFYDKLFTAISENDWVSDSSVDNSDYLNQMLQNNEYYITTMSANDNECEYDANGNKKTDINKYVYNQDLWSNTDNIYAVNDEYVRQQALTDYEYQKSIISEKESRIDTRMENLETEQSSINQMIQGIEAVRDNNVETYFSVFT